MIQSAVRCTAALLFFGCGKLDLPHRFADELGEQGADLLGRMVPSVQHAGDGQGLLAELVHELMNGRASLHGETPVEMI